MCPSVQHIGKQKPCCFHFFVAFRIIFCVSYVHSGTFTYSFVAVSILFFMCFICIFFFCLLLSLYFVASETLCVFYFFKKKSCLPHIELYFWCYSHLNVHKHTFSHKTFRICKMPHNL